MCCLHTTSLGPQPDLVSDMVEAEETALGLSVWHTHQSHPLTETLPNTYFLLPAEPLADTWGNHAAGWCVLASRHIREAQKPQRVRRNWRIAWEPTVQDC